MHLPKKRQTKRRSDAQIVNSSLAFQTSAACSLAGLLSSLEPRPSSASFIRAEPSMSAIGTKRTSIWTLIMSAFDGKADIAARLADVG
jgi:hypothetical protein